MTTTSSNLNFTKSRRFGAVVMALLVALSALTLVGLTGASTRAANFGTVKMQTAGTCTDANAETLNHGGTCTVAIGDNEQATPRHTPHLPCADIELIGTGMAFATGTYTIDSIAPTGSGQAYLSPASPATWHYDQVKAGEQVIDIVNVKILVDNAIALGADAHPIQGYHFKLEFTQDPQKHKTFWVNCNAPTPPVASSCIENTFSQLSPASGGSVQPGQPVSALYTDETGLNNATPYEVVFTLTSPGGAVTPLVPSVQFQQGGYGIHGNTVATITATVPANLPAGAYTVFLKAYDTDQNKGVGGQDCGVATWTVTVTTPPPPGASALHASIFLCDAAGAPTTTPEPGAFTYLTGSTTGTGSSPLAVAVPAGSYQVAAVPGTGFQLVACGSTAGIASQAVVVPAGGVGTATFYASPQAAGPPVTCPTGDAFMTSHDFVVGGQHFATLAGHVVPGQVVTANFAIAAGCTDEQVSLVSYQAPAATFSAGTADQQTVSDSATGVFGAGDHTMTVTVPDCFFQVDFVRGAVITKLGPAGSNNFYSAQDRLISADNGGSTSCAPTPPPPPPPADGTLAGRIFLCQDGTMTSTPEPGTIAFTGALSGSGAAPLTQQVTAGEYTVTATAGQGFKLVACGATAGLSSQALHVPSGGSAGASFYETRTDPAADCDGDHDASNCAPGHDCDDASQRGTAPCQGTLVAVVNLCVDGAMSQIPEPGTAAYTGQGVSGSGAAPLTQALSPGTYSVTATAGAGFQLVSCGIGGGNPQPVTVTTGDITTVTFFEAFLPGTLTGVIKDCAGNVLMGGAVTQSGTNVQAPASLVEAPGTYTVTATPPANDVMVTCNGAGGTVAPSGTSAVQSGTVLPAATTTVVFFAQPVTSGVLGCTTACGAGSGSPTVQSGALPLPGGAVQGVLGAATAHQGVLGAATTQPNTGREDWVLRALTALLLVVMGGALLRGRRPNRDPRD